MTNQPPVYIIDDEPEVCRSLMMLFNGVGMDARTFNSAESFLGALDRLPLGVVVSDVRMPGLDGISLIAALGDRGRDDPVIVISGHADVPVAVQALKAGAIDFIEKPFEAETIIGSVSAASATPKAKTQQMLASLTGREMDVFTFLMDGASNKHIALELGISPRTVEVYRANLMEKLHATSLSRLVRLGVEAGITPKLQAD